MYKFWLAAGFSLPSVLVGTALVGILAVVMQQVIQNSQKGSAAVSNKLKVVDLSSSIRLLSTQGTVCRLAFPPDLKIVDDNPIALSEIKIGSQIIAKKDEITQGVKITQIEFTPYFGVYDHTKTLKAAAIHLKGLFVNEAYGKKDFDEKIPFLVETRPDDKTIDACAGANEYPPVKICEALGLEYNTATETCANFNKIQDCKTLKGPGALVYGVDANGNLLCEFPPPPPAVPPAPVIKEYLFYYPWQNIYKSNGDPRPCRAAGTCSYWGGDVSTTGNSVSDYCGRSGSGQVTAGNPTGACAAYGLDFVILHSCPAGRTNDRIVRCRTKSP